MRVQKLDDKTVGIFFEYSPALVSIIKSLPGRMYEPRLKAWLLPMQDGLFVSNLKRLASAGFAVPAELYEQGRPLSPREVKKPVIGHLNALNLPLYPFQRDIIVEMQQKPNCILNTFCGSGKTLCMIADAKLNNSISNLVVCPKSVLFNWKNEIKKFLPDAKSFVVTGGKKEREKIYKEYSNFKTMKFLIVSYEIMRIDIVNINEL